jgi:MFS family permease
VLVSACGTFSLSQTLVFPALPALAASVGAGPVAGSWILTAFLLSTSIATPIAGKLGDVHGKGRALAAVMTVFCLGSAVCAVAETIEVLLLGRVLQGVGGGCFPLAFGIARDTVAPERLGSALGMISAVFGVGAGLGLPLSGLIVDHLDVRWLFWLTLTGLPAAVAGRRLVTRRVTAAAARVDWPGAALLSLATGVLLVGISQAGTWGWRSPTTLAVLAAGAVLGAVWLAVEARADEPLIDIRALRSRAVAFTNATGFLFGVSLITGFLLIPQLAQEPVQTGYGFGSSVTVAGMLLLPAALVQLIASSVAARVGARLGFRATLAAGSLWTSAAFVLLVIAHAHLWQLVAASVLLGCGLAAGFTSMATLIVEAVAQSEVGIAAGINTVMRFLGSAFAAAAITAVLEGSAAGAAGAPAEAGYVTAFVLAAGAGALAFASTLCIPGRRRRATPRLDPAEAAT